MSVRPTASPEPFRVWTSLFRALPSRSTFVRIAARRAWKSPKFEQEEISR